MPEVTVDPEVIETPEVVTPSAEDKVRELEALLAQTRKEAEEAKKGLSTAHKTLSEKDLQLKRQQALDGRLATIEETQKILATLIAEGQPTSDEMPEDKARRIGKYQELVSGLEAKQKQTAIDTQRQVYNQQADTVWERAKALSLTEQDDDYWTVYEALQSGNLRKAEVKLMKLEKAKIDSVAPVKVPDAISDKQETEDERIERLVQERMDKRGLLATDTAIPSGRSGNKAVSVKNLAEGPFDFKKLREMGFK